MSKFNSYFGGPSFPDERNVRFSWLGVMSNEMGASGKNPASAGVDGGVGGGPDRWELPSLGH